MRKRNILVLTIVLMAIGFAVVTTNLIINGTTTIGNKADDYDIKFTKAILDGIEDNSLIIENGNKISYETKKLINVGDTSELVYEITNNSSQYDASVSINCTPKGTVTHTNLYTINTTNTPGTIKARTSKSGSIKITLTNLPTENIREEFECTLNIDAVERTSIGTEGNESGIVYGVKRLISSSDTTWERIESSKGLIANATHDGTSVQNDFDSIYPWSEIITYNYDDATKEETAVIGDDNFAFDGSNGQVLTRIPEFYYKREQKDGYEYIYISKYKLEGYTKSEQFSIGRYTMSGDSNHVYSRSGYAPLVNTTITEFRNYARNLGKDENDNYYFGQLDWRYFIIQLLYLVEYADYNNQNVLGLGNTGSSSTSLTTSGGCDTLGMKSGTLNNDGKHSVIYRGIEDIFGNVWQFVDGINIKDNVAYISYNPETYESDKFDGNYQMLDYTNASNNGYPSVLGYDVNHPLAGFPTSVGGDENTYISDYYYQNPGNRIARLGGCYGTGFGAGLWYLNFGEASSFVWARNGARLLRYQ